MEITIPLLAYTCLLNTSPFITDTTCTPLKQSVKASHNKTNDVSNEHSPKTSIFDLDERLTQTVTIDLDQSSISKTLLRLSRATNVRLLASDQFIGVGSISVHFSSTPLADIMDAIAALYKLEWKKNGEGKNATYTLCSSDRQYEVFLPDNEIAKARFKSGSLLLKEIDRLSPVDKDSLLSKSRGGMSYAELPETIKSPITEMFSLFLLERQRSGKQSPLSVADLPGANFQFKIDPKGPFTSYKLTVGNSRGSMMWSFNDLEQRLQERQAALKAAGGDAVYYSTWDSLPSSLQQSSNELLDQRQQDLSLKINNSSFYSELRSITADHHINFVMDKNQSTAQKITLHAHTLRELLDKLVAEYPGIQWELRRENTIVFRSPLNPANTAVKANRLLPKSASDFSRVPTILALPEGHTIQPPH